MNEKIEAAKNLGAYRELVGRIAAGKTTGGSDEEKEALQESMEACREIIGGAFPFKEIQEAIAIGKKEYQKEFPNQYI